MKPLILTLFYAYIAFFPIGIYAQVNDDFHDGNFTQNPVWKGDTANFEVTSGLQLRLRSIGVDTSVLYTETTYLGDTEWQFWFRMAFSPSDNNYLRFYLTSDTTNLKSAVNGYFIRYGENGSADGIDLWKQSGNTLVKLIDGTPNPSATSTNQQIRVKVLRSSSGMWTLLADYSGSQTFDTLGTATDTSHNTTSLIGIWCKYTASNATNFYFDDIYAGPVIVDTTAPSVISVHIVSPDTIDIGFSEPVSQLSASNLLHYSLSGMGNPSQVIYNTLHPDRVKLTWNSLMNSEEEHMLSIHSIEDLAGNVMSILNWPLMYYRGQQFDLLITEIMADPSPVVGLPETEYIELYNNKPFTINLDGWKIKIGNNERIIPPVTILPDSFLVIFPNSIPAELSHLNTIAIPSLPALVNSGSTVALLSPDNEIIHEVSYALSWYGSTAKSDGGWSLEMKNLKNVCGGASNWAASEHPSGGTPGTRNSVNYTSAVMFSIQYVRMLSENAVEVSLSHAANTQYITTTDFFIDAGIGYPDSIELVSPSLFKLYFPSFFQEQVTYTLSLSANITNCLEQSLHGTSTVQFSYYLPKQNDIIITEIMANEQPSQGLPAYEYIEIYNRSNVYISLADWTLRIGNTSRTLPDVVLPPKNYLTLTQTNAAPLFLPQSIGIASFPALPNTGATVSLISPNGSWIHSVSYLSTWIKETHKRNGGWSLEMLDTENPCGEKENWGASVHPDGGTPGAINSIASSNPDNTPPFPLGIGIMAPDSIWIYFSERIKTPVSVQQFHIDHGMENPILTKPQTPQMNIVSMKLGKQLLPNVTYTLEFTQSLHDCVGNLLQIIRSLQFRIPETANPSDIIINEVLFDPKENGEDYIELFNRSNKALDLAQLYVSDYDSLSKQLSNVKMLTSTSRIVMPGEYVLLSRDRFDVYAHYYTQDPSAFWDISSMPSLPNSGGSIAISNENFTVIDAFTFTDKFHFSLLNNKDGASLERIRSEQPTQSRYNWTSASSTSGYGTPGYQNSQTGSIPNFDDVISLSPEIFSPDNDGFDDILFISYQFDTPGNVMHISIYDELGRLVKKPVNGEYCGISGQFSWDGSTENNIRPKIGIYTVIAEWFNESGEKGRAKKAVVLATRL